MRQGMVIALAGALLASSLTAPPGAQAEDPEAPVVEEILGVLQERGLIDPAEHDRLVTRYQAQEVERRSGLPRIRLSGDLRLRGEGFWYDDDDVADDSNRYRGRYRARIAATADVNRYLTAYVRLVSGEGDNRSANVSFGRKGPDFDYDPIFVDRASLEARAPEHWLPAGASAAIEGGKQPNPFLWKVVSDEMLWDNDIMPEGVALRARAELARGVELFANAGYFVIDENASNSDPHLVGTQLGVEWSDAPLAAGLRGTFYAFRSLDAAFLERGEDGTGGVTASAGNLPGLVSGSDQIDVGEIGAYLGWRGSEGWPVTLFGYLSNNFSARSTSLTPQADDEGLAWLVGLEVGDKREVAAFSASYIHLEANAFPSQYVESDFVDGQTNREALAFQGVRQILPRTDFAVTLFLSEPLDDALPDFEDSVGGARRLRLQTDIVVGF